MLLTGLLRSRPLVRIQLGAPHHNDIVRTAYADTGQPVEVNVTGAIDYAASGPLTGLDSVHASVLADIPRDAVEICRPVHSLVIEPNDAESLGAAADRFSENQIRPVGKLIDALLALDPAPLAVAREPDRRVIGTCRHFAVLSCALLRYRGIAARVRCGFATYFHPGQGLDHWITEYWHRDEDRWVRIDPEILGRSVLPAPDDLRVGDFLSAGEAWTAFRNGQIDASRFGVYGTENWGRLRFAATQSRISPH